jgi:hypothetical protein
MKSLKYFFLNILNDFNLTIKQNKLLLIVAVLISFFALMVYATTVPDVNTGYADSDEFITVAKVLGVAHPPSYPLYTLTAAVAGNLPLPWTFAGRVNFINSIYHSLTVFFVFLSTYLLLKKFSEEQKIRIAVAGIASAALIFSFSFWIYGITTEVFSLNNLFIAIIFFLLLIWQESLEKKKSSRGEVLLLISCFIFGLGLSNQQVILLFIPAFVFFVFSFNITIIKGWRLLILGVVLLSVGALLPYVYLPIAAKNQTVINWENPDNAGAIYRAITRRTFAESSPGRQAYLGGKFDIKHSLEGVQRFADYLIINFSLPLFIMGVLGLILLIYKKQYRLIIFLLLGLLGSGLFFSMYAPFEVRPQDAYFKVHTGIYQRFFVSSLIVVSFLIALGILGSYLTLKNYNVKYPAILLGLFIGLVVWMGSENLMQIRNNDFTIANRFGKALLNSLEPNAVLLCFSEHSCFTGVYTQQVEGVRKDVLILQAGLTQLPIEQMRKQYPGLFLTTTNRVTADHSILVVRDIIRWQMDKRPLYVAGINNNPQILSAYGLYGDPFFMIPQGCAMRISRNFQVSEQNTECLKLSKDVEGSYLADKNTITQMFKAYLAYAHYINAFQYTDNGCPEKAFFEFDQTIKLNPDFQAARQALDNLSKVPNNKYCLQFKEGPKFEDLMKLSNDSEEKGDMAYALYYANQAAAVDPTNISGRLKLADLFIKHQAYNNAKIEFNDILVLDNNNSEAKSGLEMIPKSF